MKQLIANIFLKYLRFWARLELKKHPDSKIIGITGSAGKSSTRNALVAILGEQFNLKVSYGANSESGIPLDILGLSVQNYSFFDWLRLAFLAPLQVLKKSNDYDLYIVEMGIDSPKAPKNMDYLLSIIQPQIGILLNARPAHSSNFDSLVKEKDPKKKLLAVSKKIAEEKMKLVQALKENDIAIINFSDPYLRTLSQKVKSRTCTFGYQKTQECQILAVKQELLNGRAETHFRFEIHNRFCEMPNFDPKKGNLLEISLTGLLLPTHYAESLAAAILVALNLELDLATIRRNLEKGFSIPPGRASLIPGVNGSLILDSSYNASSMEEMIEMVKQLKIDKNGRKIALLGDIRELGEETAIIHQQIAKAASKSFDLIFLLGPAMQEYAFPILKRESAAEVIICRNSLEAADSLKKVLQKGDFLFVKGSQNQLYLEEAVEKLLADPSLAKKELCRQSPWWKEEKKKYFQKLKRSKT